MATAKFIKIITGSNSEKEPIVYDLNVVIATTGFTGEVSYSAKEFPKGISLEGNLLTVYYITSALRIGIIVSDKYENSAVAETTIISFGSLFADFSGNKDLLSKRDKVQSEWASIIGDGKVKGK